MGGKKLRVTSELLKKVTASWQLWHFAYFINSVTDPSEHFQDACPSAMSGGDSRAAGYRRKDRSANESWEGTIIAG